MMERTQLKSVQILLPICVWLGLVLLIAVLEVIPVSAARLNSTVKTPLPDVVVSGGNAWADWTYTDINNATLSFLTVTGTVTVSNRTNLSAPCGMRGDTVIGTDTNFPGAWYTPTPPSTAEWMGMLVDNTPSGSQGLYDVTITFSQPITNPKFHFLNLDAGTIDFSATMDSSGGAVSLTRLSGNNEFEVVATIVNNTTADPIFGGCEDNSGGNRNGGCGTVRLNGAYQTVVFRVTDNYLDTGSGDGFAFTVSMPISALAVSKTANPTLAGVGDTIVYTYRITNTGDLDVNSLVAVDDKLGSVTLGATSLIPSVFTTGTLSYAVQASDLPGPLVNRVAVTGTSVSSPTIVATDDAQVTLSMPISALAVSKTANPTSAGVGDTIVYTYRITNTGDLDVNSLVAVDDKVGSVTLGATSLIPGAFTTGTLSYAVQAGDLPGPLVNRVVVTGTSVSSPTILATDDAQVTLSSEPTPKPTPGKDDDDDDDAVEPAPPPVPPAAQEFNCWPWLVVIPPLSIPDAGVECPASLGAQLPAASSFRFLGHSTDVTIKDAAGNLVTQFNPPIKICFRYNQPDLDALGGEPANFLIQAFRNGVWESLPTTPESDPSSQVLGRTCAPVDHLTLFALFDRGSSEASVQPAAALGVKYLPETGLRPIEPWQPIVGRVMFAGAALAIGFGVWVVIRWRK